MAVFVVFFLVVSTSSLFCPFFLHLCLLLLFLFLHLAGMNIAFFFDAPIFQAPPAPTLEPLTTRLAHAKLALDMCPRRATDAFGGDPVAVDAVADVNRVHLTVHYAVQ